MNSALFRNRSIARLSDAVRIDTQVFDDLGPVGTDPRWDVLYGFASYLERTYPLVHGTLKLEKINTHGLVYTWSGEDPNLKPTLLLAHQDTVPVQEATLAEWTHPPWSGFVDEENIWGRGSIDCKSQLTAILDAVEELISHGFKPRRTLLLAFGFDEEASGVQGARYIARFLQERYGEDSIAVIVDEGAPLQYKWGGLFALPTVGEKGYLDVGVTVRTPGGHSSAPPEHTSIGILSDLITVIESNVYKPWLDEKNPYLDQLRCGAVHGPRFPDKVRKLLRGHRERRPHETDALAEEIAKEGPRIRYLVQTSSAVDVISGGDKVNALPESASVKINYRINVGETVEEIKQHVLKLATQTAKKYNLTVNDFSNNSSSTAIQTNFITLGILKEALRPSPITPTSITSLSSPYAVLAGTTKAVFGEQVIVAPGIMTGNTDTRHFWDLTRDIFRFGVAMDPSGDDSGVHTVNERQNIDAHVKGTVWISRFIRNMDEVEE
ncbi:hypothetical protein BDW59DRAFT_182032 [Aspergillus cavernicola]|uniref:Peptidase M20 dimerisation domain-containing protein n=1 Tax=Aspergillus cavernicola TaxID=176166 RepID=A0ABR4HR21_9EURO